MGREFKGRTFLEISAGDLLSSANLRCDLFLYLPLNDRMLKIRARELTLEPTELARFAAKGNARFFILDPKKHPDAYDFSHLSANPLNPKLPAGYLPEELASEFADGKILNKENSAFDAGTLLDKPASREGDAASSKKQASQEEEASGKKEFETEASEKRPGGFFVEEETETKIKASPQEEEAEQLVRGSAALAEEEIRIAPSKEEAEAITKVEGGLGAPDDSETTLAADSAEAEKESKVEGAQASEDELALVFGAEKQEVDKTVKVFAQEKKKKEAGKTFTFEAEEEEEPEKVMQIKSLAQPRQEARNDIQNLEDELAKISPGGKDFVEKLKRIGSADPNATDIAYAFGKDEDDTPGVTKEDRAANKFSRNLGSHLGLLRKELNLAAQTVPSNEKEAKELWDRQESLREAITKAETTSVLLETLDELSPSDKEQKLEIIKELEANLAAMRGSKLLSESDHQMLDRKLRKEKARELPMGAEGVQKLGKKLREVLGERQEKGKLSPEELRQLNESVAKEVKAAQTGAKISRTIARLRKDLTKILNSPPASKEEQAANELKAKKILQSISRLEQLKLSVEAGEEIDPKDIAPFQDKDFSSPQLGDDEASIKNALSQLEAAEKSVLNSLQEAHNAEAQLKATIAGEAPNLEAEKVLEEAAPENWQAEKIQGLDQAREAIAQLQELQNASQANGEPLSSEKMAKLSETASEQIQRAQWISNVEKKIESAQTALSQVLAAAPEDPEQKAEAEEQAFLLHQDIQELHHLEKSLRDGKAVSPEKMAAIDAPLIKLSSVDQALDSIDKLKQEAVATHRKAVNSGEALSQNLVSSELSLFKEKAAKPEGLGAAAKSVSRFLKEFQESGKVDPNAIWKINQNVSQEVQNALAEKNIATTIIKMSQEVDAFERRIAAGEPEEEIRKLISGKKEEMQHLHKMGASLARGESVPAEKLSPYLGVASENFVISAAQDPAEEVRKVVGAIQELEASVVRVKAEAMEAMASTVIRGHQEDAALNADAVKVIPATPNPEEEKKKIEREKVADEAFSRIISDKDGKALQIGVCAAALFRAFGYRNPELEKDLFTACYLWEEPQSDVQASFPPRVALLHQACRSATGEEEMVLRDLAQAAQIARGYMAQPGVITGRISLDPTIFANFCQEWMAKDGRAMDSELVERARQRAEQGIPVAEREELVGLAQYVKQKTGNWRQSQAS